MRIQFLLFWMLIAGLTGFGQSTGVINEAMQGYLKPKGKNPIHSIQLYLSQGDKVFCGAAGFSDGVGKQADKDNQFKIASITKTMTATVILQMQEEGRLDIAEKASKYLKEVPFVRVSELSYYDGKPYGDSITLKQLLQHQSGLADIFTDGAFRFYLNELMHKKQTWIQDCLVSCQEDSLLRKRQSGKTSFQHN